MRLKWVMMLAVALLAVGAVGPGQASARYCGSAYGDSYSFEDVNREFVTSHRYAVYKLGATACAFARQWASRLSYNKHRPGPLVDKIQPLPRWSRGAPGMPGRPEREAPECADDGHREPGA